MSPYSQKCSFLWSLRYPLCPICLARSLSKTFNIICDFVRCFENLLYNKKFPIIFCKILADTAKTYNICPIFEFFLWKFAENSSVPFPWATYAAIPLTSRLHGKHCFPQTSGHSQRMSTTFEGPTEKLHPVSCGVLLCFTSIIHCNFEKWFTLRFHHCCAAQWLHCYCTKVA